MTADWRSVRLVAVFGISLAGAACGGDNGGTPATAGSVNAPASGATAGGNSAPTIRGNPPAAVVQERLYAFQPDAADADGDPLTFSVSNLPRWAAFSTANGTLHGTPSPGDIGVYDRIVISVSDGTASRSLDAFSITVTATAAGSAVLTWLPPTENTDGSPLTDLKGYKVYWGTKSGVYSDSINIDNPGVTTYMVENLVPATYYFVATAVNSVGAESEPSNEAASTVL